MSKDKKYHNLDDITKKDIFKAPENYFESLQGRIEKRIESQKPETRILGMSVNTTKYVALAVAASIALLIVFLPSKLTDLSSPSAAELIASISDEEALTFLRLSDVEVDDLLDLSEPGLWDGVMDDSIPDTTDDIIEQDEDFLYEQYGVTKDDNMQLL